MKKLKYTSSVLLDYSVGLFGIIVLSTILGLLFGPLLIYQTGNDFGSAFARDLSPVLVGILIITVFYLIYKVTGDAVFLAYPIIVYSIIGPLIDGSKVSVYLADLSDLEGLSYLSDVFIVLLSYVFIYASERMISVLLKRGRFKDHPYLNKEGIVINVLLSILIILSIVGLVVHKDKLKVIAAYNDSTTYPYIENQDFKIFRNEQFGGSLILLYNLKDNKGVNYTDDIERWTFADGGGRFSDSRDACGDSVSLREKPTFTDAYNYKASETGEYAIAEGIYRNGSLEYKRYSICFELDGRKVVIVRDEKNGNEHIKSVSPEAVVGAFSSVKYYKICDKPENLVCTEEDVNLTTKSAVTNLIEPNRY